MIFKVWVDTLRDWFTPPLELLYGPRRLLAWLVVMAAIGIIMVGVRLLPKDDPTRVFIEGLIAMLPLRQSRATPDDGGPGAEPIPAG